MPGGVLDVVGIDGAVRLKLLAAVGVAARVVQRNAALPKMRRLRRGERCHAIETGRGSLDASVFEIVDGARERLTDLAGLRARTNRKQRQTEHRDEHAASVEAEPLIAMFQHRVRVVRGASTCVSRLVGVRSELG
jgi:hypothetical protein